MVISLPSVVGTISFEMEGALIWLRMSPLTFVMAVALWSAIMKISLGYSIE